MKIKTSELTNAALDWAVAKAEGHDWRMGEMNMPQFTEKETSCWRHWYPSTNWAQGGPIIEREGIYLWRPYGVNGAWSSKLDSWQDERVMHDDLPLVAAMRCYVASKLGDEVDVPEELV